MSFSAVICDIERNVVNFSMIDRHDAVVTVRMSPSEKYHLSDDWGPYE